MRDPILWSAALVMAYSGCVLLFQSGEKRARHPAVRLTEETHRFAKPAAIAALFGALLPISITTGLEKGVAIWIAMAALSGISSLLVSAFVPRAHLISIPILFGVMTLVTAGVAGFNGEQE